MQNPDIFARFRRRMAETQAQPSVRLSPWRCRFLGDTHYIREGEVPNAFHRFMQRLFFGARWTRRYGPVERTELAALIEKARSHVMTPEEREAQRQSWVRAERELD